MTDEAADGVIMMALGGFRFSLVTAAYQSLRRTSEYRWPRQDRIGREPARQYVGPGDQTIELKGAIYPYYKGGLGQIDAMRANAGLGIALDLMDGLGDYRGKWVITTVEETRTLFFPDGAPRKIEFRLSLKYYGEDS